ncbi:MAG: hypothetical protein ACYDAQ_06535 [Mycobacteriales bacterium]
MAGVAIAPALLVYVALGAVTTHGWKDLGYIQLGSSLLATPHTGGLNTFATFPLLQMGPLTLGLVRLLWLANPYRLAGLAWLVGALLLAVTVGFAQSAALVGATDRRAVRIATGLGGAVLAAGWVDMVQNWGHLDDAAALAALAASWAATRSGRSLWAGVALGVAVGFQPVAILSAALLLLAPDRRKALLGAAVSVAAVWAPFVLAAPATIGRLASVHIQVDAGSVLHLVLPLHSPAPVWVRPAQIALALCAGWWMVRRGRGEAVLLVAAVARLGIDAGDWPYYTVQLMTGVLLYEVYRAGRGASALGSIGLRALVPWVLLDFDPFALPLAPALVRLLVILGVMVTVLPKPRGALAWVRTRTSPRWRVAA